MNNLKQLLVCLWIFKLVSIAGSCTRRSSLSWFPLKILLLSNVSIYSFNGQSDVACLRGFCFYSIDSEWSRKKSCNNLFRNMLFIWLLYTLSCNCFCIGNYSCLLKCSKYSWSRPVRLLKLNGSSLLRETLCLRKLN